MGLETTTFLDGLNYSWPLGTDPGPQGDDHLRLIKSVLKGTFPGAGGNGFSKQIIATEDELNHLTGLTVNVTTALASVVFPTGTILPFYNAAPPTGWTLVTLSTTYMLIASASYVEGAGSDDPILNDKVSSHTHATSGGTISEADAHAHNISFSSLAGALIDGGGPGWFQIVSNTPVATSTSGSHTHSISGLTVSANTDAANWAPRYLGLILCSKN